MSERVLSADVEAVFDGGGAPCYRVYCETKRGEVFEYPTLFYSEEGAEKAHKFAARIQNVGIIDPSRWTFRRAIYGSRAYFEDGHEERQREDEAEADGRPAPWL